MGARERRLSSARAAAGTSNERLAHEWRLLGAAATAVAVLTSPALFVVLHDGHGLTLAAALVGAVAGVAAFRGLIELVARRLLPSPALYGADAATVADHVMKQRRLWYWRRRYRRLAQLGVVVGLTMVATQAYELLTGSRASPTELAASVGEAFVTVLPTLLVLAIQLPLFLLINVVILFGPLLFFGAKQIRAHEPGDADWGVALDDVRGQREAKDEVARVVSLWQAGDAFERAGGKRERGLLLLGAPGTGKTMLSKAMATSFRCPFVTAPGSGFAQAFIGIDVVLVRLLARKAKRLARKWGGQCIVFIDEIDALGLRRASLAGAARALATSPASFHDHCFFGPMGALTPSGDLVLETRAWRERLFAARVVATDAAGARPSGRLRDSISRFIAPTALGAGGGMALNQLLVVMDGIESPPGWKSFLTSRANTFLDALFVVPSRLGRLALRIRPPRPSREQIYFIGATNVPMEALDPALTRPGRLGRHIWLETPTKDDRKEIFELYLDHVYHEPELDADERRDELARITNGYSPAMIDQVCSMALALAHADRRERFGWDDIVEAMTTVETGTAERIEYVPAETRALAIHEAGHAVTGHVCMKGALSTRLSIRKRGGALGHHQAIEKEERFSSWQHEEVAKLTWTLGAMAAERVFYGENSTGVGGDVMSATARAAWMVGSCAMAPTQVDVERARAAGLQIMRRAGAGGPFDSDPLAGVLADKTKRVAVAELLGQAYHTAYHVILANRDEVERLAAILIERHELHGDEVLETLDGLNLREPATDPLDEESWPSL